MFVHTWRSYMFLSSHFVFLYCVYTRVYYCVVSVVVNFCTEFKNIHAMSLQFNNANLNL